VSVVDVLFNVVVLYLVVKLTSIILCISYMSKSTSIDTLYDYNEVYMGVIYYIVWVSICRRPSLTICVYRL